MAIYKGREVQLDYFLNQSSPLVNFVNQDGSNRTDSLSKFKLSEEEAKELRERNQLDIQLIETPKSTKTEPKKTK